MNTSFTVAASIDDRFVPVADDVAGGGDVIVSVGEAVVVGWFFFIADDIDEFEFLSGVDIVFSVAISTIADNGDRFVAETATVSSSGDVIISLGEAVVVGIFFFDIAFSVAVSTVANNGDIFVAEAATVSSGGDDIISGGEAVVVGRFFFVVDEIDEFEFPSGVDIAFSVAVPAAADNGDRFVTKADGVASDGDVTISVGGAVVTSRFFFDADEIDEFEVIEFRLYDLPIFRFLGGMVADVFDNYCGTLRNELLLLLMMMMMMMNYYYE